VDSNIRRVGNDGNYNPVAKDSVPRWLVMSTEKAARQILRAAARGKREAIITNHGRILVAIERFAPWLIRAAGRKMNKAS
jgi:short-subunit dehydrogenase